MKKVATLLLLFLSSLGYSQNNGYYGKKGYIEFLSTHNFPIIYNLLSSNDVLKVENGQLVDRKQWYSPGFRVVLGVVGKKSSGVSFEYGIDFYRMAGPQVVKTDEGTPIVYHESIPIRTNRFMIKIEMGNKNNLSPMGIIHQLGFGVSSTKIKQQNYSYQEKFNPTPQLQTISYPTDDPYNMLQVMYGFKKRVPINKSLLFSFGIRYNLNFGLDTLSFIKYKRIGDEVKSRLFSNVINLDIGLTLPFKKKKK